MERKGEGGRRGGSGGGRKIKKRINDKYDFFKKRK